MGVALPPAGKLVLRPRKICSTCSLLRLPLGFCACTMTTWACAAPMPAARRRAMMCDLIDMGLSLEHEVERDGEGIAAGTGRIGGRLVDQEALGARVLDANMVVLGFEGHVLVHIPADTDAARVLVADRSVGQSLNAALQLRCIAGADQWRQL